MSNAPFTNQPLGHLCEPSTQSTQLLLNHTKNFSLEIRKYPCVVTKRIRNPVIMSAHSGQVPEPFQNGIFETFGCHDRCQHFQEILQITIQSTLPSGNRLSLHCFVSSEITEKLQTSKWQFHYVCTQSKAGFSCFSFFWFVLVAIVVSLKEKKNYR